MTDKEPTDVSPAERLLKDVRQRASQGDLAGAIACLEVGVSGNSWTLNDKRRAMALLLTLLARAGRLDDGCNVAEWFFQADPEEIIDTTIKARLVMNYAGILAARGDTSRALDVLTYLYLRAQAPSSNVEQGDLCRLSNLMKTVLLAQADAENISLGSATTASHHLKISYATILYHEGNHVESAQLCRDVLRETREEPPSRLRAIALSNLGMSLGGMKRWSDALDNISRGYRMMLADHEIQRSVGNLIESNYRLMRTAAQKAGVSFFDDDPYDTEVK